MKIKLLLFLLILQLAGVASAGQNPLFTIRPTNPFQGQAVVVGVWLGLTDCAGLIVTADGLLRHNTIVEGNTVKLLTYSDFSSICPPIINIPNISYPLWDLGLPAAQYNLQLYILDEGTPFPLPEGFVLNLRAELQFEVRAPINIGTLDRQNIILLMLLLLFIFWYKAINQMDYSTKS
jgi:hypothetical protein